MNYAYEAINSLGATVPGELEAASEAELVRRLQMQQLVVTDIRPARESSSGLARKATKKDLLVSFHEMTTLLESGVSIADTLESQSHATYPESLLRQYRQMSVSIRRGQSFAEALAGADFDLPSYFHHLAKAGELTGNLSASLREAVDQFEYELQLSRDLKSALMYPAILVIASLSAVMLIFVFVVPKFAPLLERSDNLPILSKIVMETGLWVNENMLMMLIIAGMIAAMLFFTVSNRKFREAMLGIMDRVPLIGRWLAETETTKWSSVMSALLSSKVDLVTALELSVQSLRNKRRRLEVVSVIADVKGGMSLGDSLEKTTVLTATALNLIRAGEKTAKLPEMMRSAAKLCDEASRVRMQRVLILIEPLAVLTMGGVVGLIIVSVILGITSVNEVNF